MGTLIIFLGFLPLFFKILKKRIEMKEKIITYLEEKGKSSVDDLASSLDMAGAQKFPSLIKGDFKLESKGKLRFEQDGTISLRKKKEKKDQVTVTGIFSC